MQDDSKKHNAANGSPETSKAGDGALDLFLTEIEEENRTGKYAATMANVDAHELLTDAQSLLKQFKSRR